MISQTVTVVNPSGLHARPAAVFAKKAGEFEAQVTVRNCTKQANPVDAKSMIAIMMLSAVAGDEVEIVAEGADEAAAVAALAELLASGCGE